jgi:hypothetical protein
MKKQQGLFDLIGSLCFWYFLTAKGQKIIAGAGFVCGEFISFGAKRNGTKEAPCHPWHRQIPYILYIKISPYDYRKTPAQFTKYVAAQIGRPWPNFALWDILSLRFTNLVNYSGGNPRDLAAPLMNVDFDSISLWSLRKYVKKAK